MRLGCCGTPEQAELFKAAGFDFVELNVQNVLRGDADDATWGAGAPDPEKIALPMEAANCLVPGNHPVVGPGANLSDLKQYMARVAARAGRLGLKRLVFGSGGARRRPEGFDPATARQQIVDFLKIAGDAVGPQGIVLTIEHLNKGETNTINALADALQLARDANHPAVAVLVDSYHFGLENESRGVIPELGGLLRHVHVAEVIKRYEPGGHKTGSGDAFDFAAFFQPIRALGYDERVAIECNWSGPMEEKLAAAAKHVRAAWHAEGR
jgi:D-psicose/D-tagatose/L-ribulose 3-epimerase